nr:hypothetical protein [Tanacetum cinerariifolium]
MILGTLNKSKKQILEYLKPQEQDTRRTSGNTTQIDPFPPSLILEAQTQVLKVLLLVLHPYNVHMILVIEFGNSYEAPPEETGTGSASESYDKKKCRTVTITTEDMQKRMNDVKARTTLLLALPDEHQLRFSKYETAQELWGAILKTFINTSIGKGEVNTASIPTASTQVSPASADVAAASISHDTIDEDDIEEMDIKWNMALLSLSQVEARLIEFKTQEIKLCEKIRGLEFDVKVKNNKIKNLMNELEQVKKEKDGLDSKLTGFESTSKDLDTLLGSQRSDKNKEGLRYSDVPLSPAQVKDKQEKDKIRTKPDENGKRGKAQQCQSPVTVKKVEKDKKIQSKGTKNANPRRCAKGHGSIFGAVAGEVDTPSDTPVCYLCTCEQCGNILSYGTCMNCNSGTRNSFTYDPIPESFDEVQIIPDPPPQFHFNIYLCQICVNPLIDHHCCYECGNSLNDFFCHQCTCKFCGNVAHLMEQMTQLKSMCEIACQIIQKKQEEKRIKEEQAANARYWKILARCDNDEDYNSAITPNEPIESLIMGDEHLNTIPAMESDEFIKSCVENLVPNPSESEGENGCDLHACFTTFSNVLFDAEYKFDSSDNQSLSDEVFSEKIFSNEEEIIPIKIDQHHHNAESDLIESMLNRDSSIISSSSKIDSLLDEFAGELTLLKSIPSGIDETDCYLENDIRLIERLLYDNSFPHPPEEFVSDNSDDDIESFSPSPIPIKDSDSLMEEINLFFTPDDPMPPGIEEDDYDSKRDILILEKLLDNYSLSLPVIESYHFDIPSFSRPPAKPPDGNTGILNIKMMGDVSNQKFAIPGLTITRVPNQEKSPDLLSHRGFEIFQLSAKRPMMICGKNIPILDVPLFHFYPLDQFKYGGNWVKLSDLKQALRERHPMLISVVQYSQKYEDSCQRILSSESSFPQLQLGI